MQGRLLIATLGLGVGAMTALGSAIGAEKTVATTSKAPSASAELIQLAQARGSYNDEYRGSYAGPPPSPKGKKPTRKSKPKPKKKKSWGDTPVVSVPE